MNELFDWEWASTHLDLFARQLGQHVSLTLLAVAIGLLIALPISIYVHRHRRLYGPVTAVAGVLYSIPSLALFALLLPFTGLGTDTAEIGLVSYTLLILIRNTVVGLDGVPPDVKETARGMGYDDRQLLWRVEIPLALPVIVAGVRLATVTTIGLVTVTAFIGKGGLGFLMLAGFRNLFPEVAVLVGLVLSVALAVLAEGLLLAGQRVLAPWSRKGVAGA
ncbi:MAG TPA: ABC transporter permease [Actinomycetota bacterium]|nr:ABC transporter permease [Actinomycetota bacterium]